MDKAAHPHRHALNPDIQALDCPSKANLAAGEVLLFSTAHAHVSQVITSLDALYCIQEKLYFQFGWKRRSAWVERKLPELSPCLFSAGLTISKSDEDCVLDVTFRSETSDSLLLLLMLLTVISAFKVNCLIIFGSLDILLQIFSTSGVGNFSLAAIQH